jgi:hypothetical protein
MRVCIFKDFEGIAFAVPLSAICIVVPENDKSSLQFHDGDTVKLDMTFEEAVDEMDDAYREVPVNPYEWISRRITEDSK